MVQKISTALEKIAQIYLQIHLQYWSLMRRGSSENFWKRSFSFISLQAKCIFSLIGSLDKDWFSKFSAECRVYRLLMVVDAKKEPIWDRGGRERSLVEIGDSHKDAATENEWEYRNWNPISRQCDNDILVLDAIDALRWPDFWVCL